MAASEPNPAPALAPADPAVPSGASYDSVLRCFRKHQIEGDDVMDLGLKMLKDLLMKYLEIRCFPRVQID